MEISLAAVDGGRGDCARAGATGDAAVGRGGSAPRLVGFGRLSSLVFRGGGGGGFGGILQGYLCLYRRTAACNQGHRWADLQADMVSRYLII